VVNELLDGSLADKSVKAWVAVELVRHGYHMKRESERERERVCERE
jgi:hypothetical protein